MGVKNLLVFIFINTLSLFALKAQDDTGFVRTDKETSDTVIVSHKEPIEIVTDTLENRPNTAALYSAALPGLGQAYNNKYWKIPIIYGGALVLGYYINYNNQLIYW